MEVGDDDAARGFFARSREGGVIERRPEFADLLERTRLLDQRAAARRPATPVPPTPTALPSPGEASVPDVAPRPESSATATPARTEPALPRSDPASVVPLIEAIAKGRFDDAEKALERVRARTPQVAEPELLAAVLYGSRFLLEGAKDPLLLRSARLSLDTFRKRGGSRRAEEAWLSPSLRALLSE